MTPTERFTMPANPVKQTFEGNPLFLHDHR